MKYRIMSSDGSVADFDPKDEPQARALYEAKKKIAEKAKVEVVDGIEIRPSVNIHRCYHIETGESINRPCEIIEEYKK